MIALLSTGYKVNDSQQIITRFCTDHWKGKTNDSDLFMWFKNSSLAAAQEIDLSVCYSAVGFIDENK